MEIYEQRGGLVPKVFRSSISFLSRLMYLRRVTLTVVILLCGMLLVV